MKSSLKAYQMEMNQAGNYADWSEAAKQFDHLSGMEAWKAKEPSPFYDYKLVRMRLEELRNTRRSKNPEQVMFYLHEGLHGNLGNIANPLLYTKPAFGTKHLIYDYLDEVGQCLDYICDNEFESVDFKTRLDFFENMAHTYGRSAIMLSGGAALGLFHIGVVKALWEEGLLPNVLSGSSAGSIICAVAGTHTDEEVASIFDPEYLYAEAFRLVGWKGILKGKTLLDGDYLENCLERNVPDMTFKEAFDRTGRMINITVSPYDHHQHPRVLNAATSPHVLIRKAVLASCAIPGVYPPVMLWAKNVDGEKCPYIPSRKWVDGSIKNDLPIRQLSRLYGVNHTIVSQTNPHVVPFLSRSDNTLGVIDSTRSLLWENFSLNAGKVLSFVRESVPSNDLGLILDKAHSVIAQDYVGDINIVPPRNPMNLTRLFKNPNPDELAVFIENGERTTWPMIEMIRNTTEISRKFQSCLAKLEKQEEQKLRSVKLSVVQ